MGKKQIGSERELSVWEGERERDGASAGKIVDSSTIWIMCQTIDSTIDLMIKDYHEPTEMHVLVVLLLLLLVLFFLLLLVLLFERNQNRTST